MSIQKEAQQNLPADLYIPKHELEFSYVNPALQKTARFLLDNGIIEEPASETLYDIWSLQGFAIPRVTGQDLPMGILGQNDGAFPKVTLVIPEPHFPLTESELEILLPRAQQSLEAVGENGTTIIAGLVNEEFEDAIDRSEREKALNVFWSPSEGWVRIITSEYPVTRIPEDSVAISRTIYEHPDLALVILPSGSDLTAEVSKMSAATNAQNLGILTFDILRELRKHVDESSLKTWLDEPSPNTYNQPPRQYLGTPQEMTLRESLLNLRFPSFS